MSMSSPGVQQRAIAFFDGQNLFRAAKDVFGYAYPNYDVKKLAAAVCAIGGWELIEVRFYTGVPEPAMDPERAHFWNNWKRDKVRAGIYVFTRPLRYSRHPPYDAREKGVDVRLSLDVVRLASENAFDVGVIFSQDSDLSEAVSDAYRVAKVQGRRIKMISAYPEGAGYGINSATTLTFDQALYEQCIDPKDYRSKQTSTFFPKGQIRAAVQRICDTYQCNPVFPVLTARGPFEGTLRAVYDHSTTVSVALQTGDTMFVFEIDGKYAPAAHAVHHKPAAIRNENNAAWVLIDPTTASDLIT